MTKVKNEAKQTRQMITYIKHYMHNHVIFLLLFKYPNITHDKLLATRVHCSIYVHVTGELNVQRPCFVRVSNFPLLVY